MSPRTLGILMAGIAVLSGVFAPLGWRVPVFKLPDLAAEMVSDLVFVLLRWIRPGIEAGSAPAVLAWTIRALLLAGGIALIRRGRSWNWNPLTARKLERFRRIRRGWLSFRILLFLVFLACLDNLLVGKRALLVRYDGRFYAPFVQGVIPATAFGGDSEAEPSYRELREKFRAEDKGNWVLMPPVPYAPRLDTPVLVVDLERHDGIFRRAGTDKPFNGRASSRFDDNPDQMHSEWVFRDGRRHGEFRVWDRSGEQTGKGRYEAGSLANFIDLSDGAVPLPDPDAMPETLKSVVYPPAPPEWRHSHFLGTSSGGLDVLALLFGGLQQACTAVPFYVTFCLLAGIVAGGLLGYLGGWFDLIGQRLLEIWSNLPFLFIVMIIASVVQPTLMILVVIVAAFSWMSPTIYMRTASYREKSRDYAAAARLLGAGPGRIVFRHILPNAIATLVTLAPFMAAGIVTTLAALDFLGFGLPPEEPSWGRLLHEGTENFNYPWIVGTAFVALASTLILITFVGEAVREAFDPKKFTTYQ